MRVGSGDFQFEPVENWERGPAGRPFGGIVPAMATDSRDRVYIARRDPAAILVYASDGRYLESWGEDVFHNPHSVWISPEDQIYIADVDDHTVRCCSTAGQVLQTWGTPGRTGAPGEPFNKPTWAVRSEAGELFVADGYGQFRVHRFAADGALLCSWGTEGSGPGQFALPHCLRLDSRGRVLAIDRENGRIQHFDVDGNYLGEWSDLGAPNDIFIDANDHVFIAEGERRISVLDLDGKVLDRWGEEGDAPGQFADHPHGIWLDSSGDLYIAEVPYINDRLQKFKRIR